MQRKKGRKRAEEQEKEALSTLMIYPRRYSLVWEGKGAWLTYRRLGVGPQRHPLAGPVAYRWYLTVTYE